MRILFADGFDTERIAALEAEGHTCRVEPELGADTLAEAIGDAEVLVVRSTKVVAATIEAATDLGLIIRAGAGVDTIDIATAASHGIHVCNVPGKNAIAVAELAMGFILALDRNLVDATSDLRNGQWDKARYKTAEGIYGQQLAVVGLGEIGLALAERARAFGMGVAALRKAGRSEAAERRIRAIGIRLVDTMEELLGEADVVSIHVPSNAETKQLVDADFLAKMPDGATLINTSRGDVVDEAALIDALNNRNFSAGLDVFADEPSKGTDSFASTLASHPRVVANHHVGASTNQAQAAVADGTLDILQAFVRGEVVNCVNMAGEIKSACVVSVRHLDQVGVLAKVFDLLRARGLNVATMENRIFAGAQAAVATIHLSGPADESLLEELRNIEEVFGATARASA